MRELWWAKYISDEEEDTRKQVKVDRLMSDTNRSYNNWFDVLEIIFNFQKFFSIFFKRDKMLKSFPCQNGSPITLYREHFISNFHN